MKKPKVKIKVFVTKTLKFRAFVKEPGQMPYEVTVGGKSWEEGKGREFEEKIVERMKHILAVLESELRKQE